MGTLDLGEKPLSLGKRQCCPAYLAQIGGEWSEVFCGFECNGKCSEFRHSVSELLAFAQAEFTGVLSPELATAVDCQGATMLHYAVGAGNYNLVLALLETPVDPFAADWLGLTPIDLAEGNERMEILFLRFQTLFESIRLEV